MTQKYFTKISVPLLAVLFLLASCTFHYNKLGNFDSYNTLADSKTDYFWRIPPQDKKKSPRLITEGDLSYYSWKVVEYKKTKGNKTYSTYKTIIEKEIDTLPIGQLDYINQENKIKINYIFFIDAYRCIYLSLDDDRSMDKDGILDIFFDDKEYKPNRDLTKLYKQMLRGYYYYDNEYLFFDFNGHENFRMSAKLSSDLNTLSNLKISNPDNKINDLNTRGLNTDYIDFNSLIDSSAHPIFEIPTSNNYNKKRFRICMGFRNANNRKNKLHKAIPTTVDCKNKTTTYYVDSITYQLDSYPKTRRYYCNTSCQFNNEKYFEINESLEFNEETEMSEISTW